jgi:adenylate cyclase
MRKSGNRVRVTGQLIDATTGGHLWAERFDRDLTDIFAVQDDVTTHIVSALALNLNAGDRQSIAAEQTDNLEAYHNFLRGRELWFGLPKTPTPKPGTCCDAPSNSTPALPPPTPSSVRRT